MNRVMGSDKDTQLDLEGLPRHVALTADVPTYQMKVSDLVLSVVSGTGADATGIVTLPSLAEAVGKFYYIVAPTGNTGDDVSLYEKETGSEYTGGGDDGDLDTDGDDIILFSTGKEWLTVLDGVT
jgi:hypothetical protein